MPTGGEVCIALMREELEARHRGFIPCIAYTEDGTICRRPATLLDRQRLGMVCAAHDPEHQHGDQHSAPPPPSARSQKQTNISMDRGTGSLPA
jgi:hypothetical protein